MNYLLAFLELNQKTESSAEKSEMTLDKFSI